MCLLNASTVAEAASWAARWPIPHYTHTSPRLGLTVLVVIVGIIVAIIRNRRRRGGLWT